MQNNMTKLFDNMAVRHQSTADVEMSLQDFLQICKDDSTAYMNPHERMLKAIGEPTIVDTAKDPRLSVIHSNAKIKVYPTFAEFHGMESVVENIVSYFKHAAQGLEESKQILYLLGPVGGGKSSLAEKLKSLMEKQPIYTIKGSPINESPLALFDPEQDGPSLKQEYGIPNRYLTGLQSPWLRKRLAEVNGDVTQLKVVKRFPSVADQIAISKTEPGDENNQDISALVGKVKLRELARRSQSDPDAYDFTGSLGLANQGMMEFVEMFKAPIKVLHPLLTATQERNYNGTENIGAIPFNGVIIAHSNESEWQAFKSDKNNEAFLDRVYILKVPYCLRVSDELMIYNKLIDSSTLKDAPQAPNTHKYLAKFSVLSRLLNPENSSIYSKLKVYDGESLRDTDPSAKSHTEYRDEANRNPQFEEGMEGISTRMAYKILARVYNYDSEEAAANPVHLFKILEEVIENEKFPPEVHDLYISHLKEHLIPEYIETIGKDIQEAYLQSYDEYGQNLFDNYLRYADMWVQEKEEYADEVSGTVINRAQIDAELRELEAKANIRNPNDFRKEVTDFSLRYLAQNRDKDKLKWTDYEKLRLVIEKKMFSSTEDLLPIISFNSKSSTEDTKKHEEFVQRMIDKGYTAKQVETLVTWYVRVRKSH